MLVFTASIMYELFLVAIVSDQEATAARAVLQGFCSMTERHSFTYVRYFLATAAGLPTIKALQKTQNSGLWHSLHQTLLKQAFIVQTRYTLNEQALVEGVE